MAALAATALMAGQAHAASIYSQDFSGGLKAGEQVGGSFSVANGFVGHQGAYRNNEYSFYQMRLDLTDVTNALLSFNFDIESEWTYDGLNLVVLSEGGASSLLRPAEGLAYDKLYDRAKNLLGPEGFSGKTKGLTTFDLASLSGQVVDIRFQFASDFAAIGRGAQIDNISVTGTLPSAVPEPATWAMMITGFGLAGGAIRNRRRWAGVAA